MMSETTPKQVLNRVLAPLRGSAVQHEASMLAFQLLAWAHISNQNELEPSDQIQTALGRGSGAVVETLARLGSRQGLVGQAFSKAATVAKYADTGLLTAAKSAKSLVDAGVFERFQVADVVPDLMLGNPGQQTLSPQLVRLVSDLALTESVASVYCPWEHTGQFVGAALLANISHVLVESQLAFPIPALISLFTDKSAVDVEIVDPLRAPSAVRGGTLQRFDATIACPPMGLKLDGAIAEQDLYNRFPIPKATATGLMVQHIVAQTYGKAAIVVPNSLLFGSGTDRDVREHLLRTKCVQAVIALPTGLLSDSHIQMAILLLDTRQACDTIKFVDATGDHFRQTISKGRNDLANGDAIVAFCREGARAPRPESPNQLPEDVAMGVVVTEVLANDAQLQVNRYVMPLERRRFQESLAAQPLFPLESIATIIPSLPNKDRDATGPDTITVFEVGAADLPPIGYIQQPSRQLDIRLPKSLRGGNSRDLFLRPHDIVLITKGSAGKVGIVPGSAPTPGSGGWIAGQSAVVLRGNADIDLRALALLLRSQRGQELLASITSGSSIQMIALSSLKKLALPVLSAHRAARAADVLDQQGQLQRQINLLQRQQSELAESLWTDLFANNAEQES